LKPILRHTRDYELKEFFIPFYLVKSTKKLEFPSDMEDNDIFTITIE